MTWSVVTVPDGGVRCWECRAIQDGGQIDFVADRQGYAGSVGDEGYKAFAAWVYGRAKPWIRKDGPGLRGDREDEAELVDGKYRARISTNASYGYLYVRAWETVAAPGQ